MKTKRKITLIIIFLLIVITIIFLFSIKMFIYFDDYIPGVTYKIKINKITKVLNGTFYHHCSAEKCDGDTYKYSIKLTKDEYEKIIKLWDDKKTLSPILENICEDTKVFYKSFEESHENSIENYNRLDSNLDGKITSREFGNQQLNDAINER